MVGLNYRKSLEVFDHALTQLLELVGSAELQDQLLEEGVIEVHYLQVSKYCGLQEVVAGTPFQFQKVNLFFGVWHYFQQSPQLDNLDQNIIGAHLSHVKFVKQSLYLLFHLSVVWVVLQELQYLFEILFGYFCI